MTLNLPTAFWGLLGPRKEWNGGFYKNREQADGNILGNPRQHDAQSKKYSQRNSYPSGIVGLARDRPGVPKDPKT